MSSRLSMKTFGYLPDQTDCRDRTTAYVVIRNEIEKVAVVVAEVRGRREYWLPGGGIEPGETDAIALTRELKEELGWRIQIGKPIGSAIQYYFAGDENVWYRMRANFYLAELAGEYSTPGQFEAEWVDPTRSIDDFFHRSHAWAASVAGELEQRDEFPFGK